MEEEKREKLLDWAGIACGLIVVLGLVLSYVLYSSGSRAGSRTRNVPSTAQDLTGTGEGRNGPIGVEIVADENGMYFIKVTDHDETWDIGTLAINNLPRSIYKAQTLNIDAVSGATFTSKGIRQAVSDALESGGIDPTIFRGGDLKLNRIATGLEAGTQSGIKFIKASDYESTYPEIYASYMKNSENDEVIEYTEADPFIKNLFAGYGFAKSYGSARGHTYVIEDITSTGRPHKLANCFTCKVPQMTEAVLSMGESAYKMSFEDMQADVLASGNEVLSCFNCHANEPGTMVVTHSYITKALGDDLKRVDGSVLACAQCHIDYYMAPGTGVVTPPWTSLESANPDSMLEYFNKLMVEDENGNSLVYADYVNPDNGVRQVMVNHPEFETFTGEGSIHRDMFTCADCHMGMAVAADGTTYKSHYLISPLQNQELIDKTCSKCHSDLAADVKKIRDETTRRETEIGQDLEALLADITECVNGGKYTDEELDAIRMSYRNAQWYWNFTYVENSEGAHNSKLTYECLDKAEAGIEATRALMRK